MSDLPDRPPRRCRTRATTLAAAALLALAPALGAQVTRAGFVPQPPPGEAPVAYAQHAFTPGSDATTLRVDVWGERWGVAAGAGYLHPDGAHDAGGTVDLALLRSLREQEVSLAGFGVQAQLGASVGRRGGGWTWEAPLTLGALWSLPVGALQGHLWSDAGVRVRGGDDQPTEAGPAVGVGVRLLALAGGASGWGAQLRGGLLHVDGATLGSVELGVSRLLVPRR